MPVVSDPDHPHRRTLVDADGLPLAHFTHVERDDRPVASRVVLEVPVERAVPFVLAELRGMRVAGTEALGRALEAAGGTAARHLHVYSHDLRERPAVPDAFDLRPIDRPAADLLPSYLAAHPPDHVDTPLIADEDSLEFLSRALAGELGPLLASSGLAIQDDRVVGAVLVASLDDPEPPFIGPWVMELFRTPGARGAGRALLQRALALCEGPTLGLAVTHGNPAKRLYVALGFERVFTTYSVDL